MANKLTPRGGARHAHYLDGSDQMPVGRSPRPSQPQLVSRPTAQLKGRAAESLLLAMFSPEELARLTPAELRQLAEADSEQLPEVTEEEQARGERRYRARLLAGLTEVEVRAKRQG